MRIILVIILLFLGSCSKEPKAVVEEKNMNDAYKLYLCNKELNEYYSDQNWEAIFNLQLKARDHGIIHGRNKEEFINGLERAYFYSTANIKTLSFSITGDSARTENLFWGRSFYIFPFEVKMYHYWKLINGKWYLEAWHAKE